MGARGHVGVVRLLLSDRFHPLLTVCIRHATHERTIRFLGDASMVDSALDEDCMSSYPGVRKPSDVSASQWADDYDALLRALPRAEPSFDADRDPIRASRFLVSEPRLLVNVVRDGKLARALPECLSEWRMVRGAVKRLSVSWWTHSSFPVLNAEEWPTDLERLAKIGDDGLLSDVSELNVNHVSAEEGDARLRQLLWRWTQRMPHLRVLHVGDPMHCGRVGELLTADLLASVLPRLHTLCCPSHQTVRTALGKMQQSQHALPLRELDIDDGGLDKVILFRAKPPRL